MTRSSRISPTKSFSRQSWRPTFSTSRTCLSSCARRSLPSPPQPETCAGRCLFPAKLPHSVDKDLSLLPASESNVANFGLETALRSTSSTQVEFYEGARSKLTGDSKDEGFFTTQNETFEFKPGTKKNLTFKICSEMHFYILKVLLMSKWGKFGLYNTFSVYNHM